MYISEVGHLLRVTSIYSQMSGFAAESSQERLRKLDPAALNCWRNAAEATIRSHESALAVRRKIGHVLIVELDSLIKTPRRILPRIGRLLCHHACTLQMRILQCTGPI